MKKIIFLSIILLQSTLISFSQSVLLYKNTFESPLIPPTTTCSPDLDQTLVNTLWGGTGLGTGGGGLFHQENTVETILINGSNNQYSDSSGLGGNYCVSMLSTLQNDRLALTLNTQMLPFINLSFIISPINLPTCGGPFQLDSTWMEVTVYDSPSGTFNFSSPGSYIASNNMKGGPPGATPYTFNWRAINMSIPIPSSTNGIVTLVFDLVQGGYAAIDSIEIYSSITSGIPSASPSLVTLNNSFTDEIVVSGTRSGGMVSVRDVTGRIIDLRKTTDDFTKLQSADYPKGYYILTYEWKGLAESHKLIKWQ